MMQRGGLQHWGLAAMVALLCTAAATAQGGRRSMMIIDDGNQRQAFSYAQPDLDVILQPYVLRNDLPTFVRYLSLSDPQASAVERMIVSYVEDFQSLMQEQHPLPAEEADDGRPGLRMALVDPRMRQQPADADASEHGQDRVDADEDDGGQLERINIRDILAAELKADGIIKESLDELPVQPGFSIGVSVDNDPESDEPPVPSIDVSIGFGTEDDRLDEALRAKLEAAAERAVPQIAEVVRQQEMANMAARDSEDSGVSPEEEIANHHAELEVLRARIDTFRAEADLLLQRLYSNVKRLLSEAQLEQWPAFERAMRRIKTLPWGSLDGESTDLIRVIEELELDETQAAKLNEALKPFELELDAALRRRNELLDEADAIIDRALYTRAFDEAESMAERLANARLAVRNLNDRTIDSLAGLVGGRTGDRIRREALAVSYPRIYRQTVGQRAFDQTILNADLDPDTQILVLELADQHLQRIAEVNQRLYQSVRREQANALTRSISRAIATIQGREESRFDELGEQSAIAAAFQERLDLDARYMRMLYGMLPDDIVAKLPAVPEHKVGDRIEAEHRERPEPLEQ